MPVSLNEAKIKGIKSKIVIFIFIDRPLSTKIRTISIDEGGPDPETIGRFHYPPLLNFFLDKKIFLKHFFS